MDNQDLRGAVGKLVDVLNKITGLVKAIPFTYLIIYSLYLIVGLFCCEKVINWIDSFFIASPATTADASDYILVKAYHIMEDNNPNTGFTFTNKNLKEAVIVIGPATSGDEFINTLCHEIYHLAAAIGESLGVKLDGEKPAYIAGDSMMELTKIICKLGCQDCN